jgi:O-antigen ligase
MQKPFFGWGYYGTEALLMDSVDPKFAYAARHAHNMFLQLLLSVGFLGSLPGLALIVLLISRFVMRPDRTLARLPCSYSYRDLVKTLYSGCRHGNALLPSLGYQEALLGAFHSGDGGLPLIITDQWT